MEEKSIFRFVNYRARVWIGLFMIVVALSAFLISYRYAPKSRSPIGEVFPRQDNTKVWDRHIVIVYDHSGSMKVERTRRNIVKTDSERIDRLNQYIRNLVVDGLDAFQRNLNASPSDEIIGGDLEPFRSTFGHCLKNERTIVTLMKFGLEETTYKADDSQQFIRDFFEVSYAEGDAISDFLQRNLPRDFPQLRSLPFYASSQFLRGINIDRSVRSQEKISAKEVILISISDFLSAQPTTGPHSAQADAVMRIDRRFLNKIGEPVAHNVNAAVEEFKRRYSVTQGPSLGVVLRSQILKDTPIYISLSTVEPLKLEKRFESNLSSLTMTHEDGRYWLDLGFLRDVGKEHFEASNIVPQLFVRDDDISSACRLIPASMKVNAAREGLPPGDVATLSLSILGEYNGNSLYQQYLPTFLQFNNITVPIIRPPLVTRELVIYRAAAVAALIFGLFFLFFGLWRFRPIPLLPAPTGAVSRKFDGSTIPIPIDVGVRKDGHNIRDVYAQVHMGEGLLNGQDVGQFVSDGKPAVGKDGLLSFESPGEASGSEAADIKHHLDRGARRVHERLCVNTSVLDGSKLPPTASFQLQIPLTFRYFLSGKNEELGNKSVNFTVNLQRRTGTWEWMSDEPIRNAVYYPDDSMSMPMRQRIGRMRFKNPVEGSQINLNLKIDNVRVSKRMIVNDELKPRRCDGNFGRLLSFDESGVKLEVTPLIHGGTITDVPIYLNLDEIEPPEHSYLVEFDVHAEGARRSEMKEYNFDVFIDISYTSVLGVDFGTSAFCAACTNAELQRKRVIEGQEGFAVPEINDVSKAGGVFGFSESDKRLLPSICVIVISDRKDSSQIGNNLKIGKEAFDTWDHSKSKNEFRIFRSLKKFIAKRRKVFGFNANKVISSLFDKLLKHTVSELSYQEIQAPSIRRVVVTHPNNFTDAQRRLLLSAYEKMRLQGNTPRFVRIYLLSESDAIIYYYLSRKRDYTEGTSENIMVLDIGGGTTDAAIIKVSYGREIEMEHLCQLSYNIGGEILDSYFARLLWGIVLNVIYVPNDIREEIFKFKRNGPPDPTSTLQVLRRNLKRRATEVKMKMSNERGEKINIRREVNMIINNILKILEERDEVQSGDSKGLLFNVPLYITISKGNGETQNQSELYFEEISIDESALLREGIPEELKPDPEGKQKNESKKCLDYQRKINEYVKEISYEVISDVFNQYEKLRGETGGAKVPLDTLIIAGRGACYREINEYIKESMKAWVEKEPEIIDLTVKDGGAEAKLCVAKGAAHFGQIMEEKEKKPPTKVFSSYGLLCLPKTGATPFYKELISIGSPYPFKMKPKEINFTNIQRNYFWCQIFAPEPVSAIENKKFHKYTVISQHFKISEDDEPKFLVELQEGDRCQLYEDGIPMIGEESYFILDNIVETDLKQVINEEFLVNYFFPEFLLD